MGNPTTYFGGETLTWKNGRQLAKYQNKDYTINYDYNMNGLRTYKEVNGVRTNYYYDDSKLLYEETAEKQTWFVYDDQDAPIGFMYGNQTYYYETNGQGDVCGIVNQDGESVVQYTYDAYGKVIGVTGDASLAKVNPIRYRGYYYDEETSWYYLQSRYYDSGVGRFINIDAIMGFNTDTSMYNLFTYCGNNPVTRHDLNGMFWAELWSGIKTVVRKVIHKVNSIAKAVGIDTAAIGAYFLQMKKDKQGIYHATFNCWQQYFGYNGLYDYMAGIVTYLNVAKFMFNYNHISYILWAWKGDYINLGAGAELGIYYGDVHGHWLVNKKLAMNMSMKVYLKGKRIINYSCKTWWLTGFNPEKSVNNANDLTIIYKVRFNTKGMYRAFKNKWKTWRYTDKSLKATYTF